MVPLALGIPRAVPRGDGRPAVDHNVVPFVAHGGPALGRPATTNGIGYFSIEYLPPFVTETIAACCAS